MEDEDEEICSGCKGYVQQRIGTYKGHTINCCAYGCDRWAKGGDYCHRNDVIRYLFDELKILDKGEDE